VVAFISTEKDARAQALLAQMELAWAESLQQLAEIDANLAARFRELADEADRKAAASGASAADFGHLKSLRAAAADAQQTSEALKVAVADHLSRGLEVARQVIKQAPTSYLGYRVAADYYRLQGDWKSFDAMIGKLEKANPDSNGLVFLKGVVAYQRGRDTAAAIRLLRQAVVNDPRFARAQAHLVMIQPTLEETWAEFVRLKKMSPSHPIVVWTGPALERLRSEAAGR
jgi:tetratricopeptide (TPR) repeat protein